MIRAFRFKDLDFKWNKYTEHYLDDYMNDIDRCDKRTLDIDGQRVIFCYFNYNLDCYKGFFLVSENFDGKNLKYLKNGINKLAEELQATRLETYSLKEKTIDVWHKLLGFKLEGVKIKAMNGNDIGIWAMLWDRS